MKAFTFLSHVADVRMKLIADSPSGLFEAALDGMNKLLLKKGGRECNQPIVKTIRVSSQDLTTLLIEFLGEVLTLSHTNRVLFSQMEIDHLDEHTFSATLSGCEADGFDEDIKAVTYHEANVHRNASGQYETIIVFDI